MSLCDECDGACCRFVSIAVAPMTADQRRWAEMRGPVRDGRWELRAACENLTSQGRCAIYDRRPNVCCEYEEGGRQCRSARKLMGVE